MKTALRHALLQQLAKMGNLYPEMRFGQLLLFAAQMAGEDTPRRIEEVQDDSLVDAIERHVAERAELSWPEPESATPTRLELHRVVEELSSRFADWPLGQLVARLAGLAHVHLYDIEDEELVTAARLNDPGVQWFERYIRKYRHESTIHPEMEGQLYRCPCCHHRTLGERGGFEICPVCFWEDDGQDDEDADTVRGGPNGSLSLTLGRANYATQGVCDERFKGHVRPPLSAEL